MMKPNSQTPHGPEPLRVGCEEAGQPAQPPMSLRRLSYQAQRDINYFVGGLDESSRKSVQICADLKAGADLMQVAAEQHIELDTLLAARNEIKKLTEQTGSADDLVRSEIIHVLLDLSPSTERSPVQAEAVQETPREDKLQLTAKAMAEKDASAQYIIHRLINKFSEDEQKTLLPDYLATDRNDQKRVTELTLKYGSRFLEAENEFADLAEALKCSVTDLRNAVGIVRGGGTVAAEHLHPKKVVIHPELNPRTAKTIIISRGLQKEPVTERIKKSIRRFLAK